MVKEYSSQSMTWNDKRNIKIAILDLYEGQENQGMRCIHAIIGNWAKENDIEISVKEFEVRLKNEVPGTDFDIYISTGGPGSPLDSVDSEWEKHYFKWFHELEEWNNGQHNFPKKHAFFICHSFQLISRHLSLGKVSKRKSTSFGVFPIHLMQDGANETVFEELKNPFYAVDSRDYQLIEPNHQKLKETGAKILALEKSRPHVPLERAVMAIRFSPYFIGTQFHPEADAVGMSVYLQRADKKETVISNHGEEKWRNMIDQLEDPNKILYTNRHILPNFLTIAAESLVEA